jgi:CDP-4-dehydro-6-deoxyglucose reductase
MAGATSVIQSETSLTQDELNAGYVLTCCRSVLSDIALGIEDLGDFADLKPKTLPARIDSLELVSEDVIAVTLRTPPASQLLFRTGQYIDVIGPEGIRRSYSLASAPRSDGKLQLEIRRVEGGQLSQYWFEKAKANDLLRIEGPFGTFSRRSTPVKNLIFLATGTGIAPVKAILEELAGSPDKSKYDKIVVYWGGRTVADVYWKPDFENLSLSFIPVLSRELEWVGRKGYVQQAVIEDGLDLSASSVYACGSETMIASAKALLVGAGLNERAFYSDAFVSSS